MIEVNGVKFAKTESEFVDSLFNIGGTATGFYKRYKNRIIFSDKDHKPMAALVRNRHGSHFVGCSKTEHGIRYMYSMDSLSERLFGMDEMGYMDQMEFIDGLTEQLID